MNSFAVFGLLCLTFVSSLSKQVDDVDLDLRIQIGDVPDLNHIGPEVIGGHEAPVGSYLYTAGMRQSKAGKNFCGGTLVSPTHIITAAHCADHIRWVSIGSHYNSGTRDGEQIEVKSVTKHPKYNRQTLEYDIAVVELSESTSKPTAALATSKDDASGITVNLHGWGRTSYPWPGHASPVLKELKVKLVSKRECVNTLGKSTGYTITDSMLCAGGIKGQSACHGDSGGPLIATSSKNEPVLVGAVSWGKPCGTGVPDAYARVSYLRPFIDKHVKNHRWLRVVV